MIDLNEKEALNLYLFLSLKDEINPALNRVMLKLERKLFSIYSVAELEAYKDEYLKKGVV